MRQCLGVCAVLAALAIGGSAQAQYNKKDFEVQPAGFTIRGGMVLPLDGPLRDVSKTFIGLGAEYTFTHQYTHNGETFFSVDWIGKDFGGSHGNIFPVCINQRMYTGQSRYGTGRAYFFVGAGLTFIDVNSATNKFGVRGGVGTEIGPSMIVEAADFFSGKDNDGVAGNAVGAYVGYRFH